MNGVDYQPQTASPNKKHAKAMAATVALQALGEVNLEVSPIWDSNLVCFSCIICSSVCSPSHKLFDVVT